MEILDSKDLAEKLKSLKLEGNEKYEKIHFFSEF
jgi:hypothetical protein